VRANGSQSCVNFCAHRRSLVRRKPAAPPPDLSHVKSRQPGHGVDHARGGLIVSLLVPHLGVSTRGSGHYAGHVDRRQIASGLSLVELLLVLAVVGVLAAIGFTQINYGGAATRQAAQVVAGTINRARIEAIRGNLTAGAEIVAASGAFASGYVRVCRIPTGDSLACPDLVDPDNIRNDPNTAYFVSFADGDLARARINTSDSVFFDRRGVMRAPRAVTISISDRTGGNERTVFIEATGRASVQ
jgi:prepilin-type N-terminal cleavage/methylation domain-containing protein